MKWGCALLFPCCAFNLCFLSSISQRLPSVMIALSTRCWKLGKVWFISWYYSRSINPFKKWDYFFLSVETSSGA